MSKAKPKTPSIDELIRFQADAHPLVKRRGFETVEDYCNHLMYQKAYEDALPIARGKRVLDLGCNDGYGSALLASAGIEVVGVDVSTKSLSEAAATYQMPSLSFVPVDGVTLPFPDAVFDMVVSFQVIEHVADYDAYLSEIRRVLRPRGVAIFTTPNARIRLDPGMRPWNAMHVKEFSAEELENLLKRWFPSVSISGLFGTPGIYEIEFKRVQGHLAKARRDRDRVIPPAWVIRAKVIDTIKMVMPEGMVKAARAMLRRPSAPSHPETGKTLGRTKSDDAFPFSTGDLFYRTDSPDRSLGLMATCTSE